MYQRWGGAATDSWHDRCRGLLHLLVASLFLFVSLFAGQQPAFADQPATPHSIVWTMLPGDTISGLARMFYPHDRNMQRLFIARTLRMNQPDARANQPYASHTNIRIPDLRYLSTQLAKPASVVTVAQVRPASSVAPVPEYIQPELMQQMLAQYEDLARRNLDMKQDLQRLNDHLQNLQDLMQRMLAQLRQLIALAAESAQRLAAAPAPVSPPATPPAPAPAPVPGASEPAAPAQIAAPELAASGDPGHTPDRSISQLDSLFPWLLTAGALLMLVLLALSWRKRNRPAKLAWGPTVEIVPARMLNTIRPSVSADAVQQAALVPLDERATGPRYLANAVSQTPAAPPSPAQGVEEMIPANVDLPQQLPMQVSEFIHNLPSLDVTQADAEQIADTKTGSASAVEETAAVVVAPLAEASTQQPLAPAVPAVLAAMPLTAAGDQSLPELKAIQGQSSNQGTISEAVAENKAVVALSHPPAPAPVSVPAESTQALRAPIIAPVVMPQDTALVEQPNAQANAEIAPEPVQQLTGEQVLASARQLVDAQQLEAAQVLLRDYIHQHPTKSVYPWLYLLEIDHSLGDKAAFMAIVERLHDTFNVVPPTWEDAETGIAVDSSLEDFPHIVEELERVWNSDSAVQYLTDLKLSTREGTRTGFSLEVLKEITILQSILETRQRER